MTDIYQLRNVELAPELAAKLWPFVNARRPHDEPRSWRTLREEGLERVETEDVWTMIEEQHAEMVEVGE